MTERGRAALRGLSRADSIVLDPHKGLFMPYGSGCLLVKDPGALRRSHSVQAHYMPGMQEDADSVDFCEISPELSRNFRGLGAWLAIKLCGLAAFRAALDEKLDLAREAVEAVRAIPGMTIVAEPQLSLFAFRYAPAGASLPESNRLSRELMDRVNARQRVLLTSTLLGETFAIRICILSFRTHRDRMGMALHDLREAAEALARE
jgi:aromatic-L-amino-acid decarboxylase